MASAPTSGIHFIAACGKKFGLGKHGQMPWHIPQDLAKFNSLTRNTVVVMGRKTFDSLPDNKRPLPDRLNLVLTSKPAVTNQYNVMFVGWMDLMYLVSVFSKDRPVWVIGGQEVFEMFLKYPKILPSTLWLTQIDKYYDADRYFPMPFEYQLISTSLNHSEEEQCRYRDLVYEYTKKPSTSEQQYLDLLKDVVENGKDRPDRTGVGTRAVFGKSLRLDMTGGFPIMTTKFVSWRVVIEELLWFLRGDTDSKKLEEKQVNIWKQNTTEDFIRQQGLDLEEGDVGGMYGYVWRHGGQKYTGPVSRRSPEGTDQLAYVLESLKNDPFSRRIIMTSNDVTNLETGVLYPCHGLLTQFYVEQQGDVRYLSCSMTQRSADCFLGLPINIASYAALTHILAAKTDMTPKDLIINTNDTHIYNNHLDSVTTQLKRSLYPSPQLVLSEAVKSKTFEELTRDDFDLAGYFYHPAIKAPMAV